MRLIHGKYGKRRFTVPAGFKARPTTDFAKENLFNVLENVLEWKGKRALDLFAGTGSIGLEFLSRGCEEVIAVEKDKKHYQFLCHIKSILSDDAYKPICMDVFTYLKLSHLAPFQLIFADPPYALDKLKDLPQLIEDSNLLADGATLIVEHPAAVDFSHHKCFHELRVYGSVHFSIFFYP